MTNFEQKRQAAREALCTLPVVHENLRRAHNKRVEIIRSFIESACSRSELLEKVVGVLRDQELYYSRGGVHFKEKELAITEATRRIRELGEPEDRANAIVRGGADRTNTIGRESTEDSMTGKEEAVRALQKLANRIHPNEWSVDNLESAYDILKRAAIGSNPLRQGLERAVEIVKELPDSYLDGSDFDAGAQDALNAIRSRLRSELEPVGEGVKWEDWPVGTIATVEVRGKYRKKAWRHLHRCFVVAGDSNAHYDDEVKEGIVTILSIDNQPDSEEVEG